MYSEKILIFQGFEANKQLLMKGGELYSKHEFCITSIFNL